MITHGDLVDFFPETCRQAVINLWGVTRLDEYYHAMEKLGSLFKTLKLSDDFSDEWTQEVYTRIKMRAEACQLKMQCARANVHGSQEFKSLLCQAKKEGMSRQDVEDALF